MNLEEQYELEHLLLQERKCRTCSETKDLIDGFYLTRKNRKGFPSAYAYECKLCTIRRIMENRKRNTTFSDWLYPDW